MSLYLLDPTYAAIQALPGRRRNRLWMPPGTSGPAAPTNFVNDTFTDTNGVTVVSHAGETGSWTGQTGWGGNSTVAIQSNRAYITTGANLLAAGTPPAADYEVTATIRIVTVLVSHIFVTGRNAAGSTQFYGARLSCFGATNWAIEVLRFDAGFSGGVIGGAAAAITTPVAGSDHTVTLRMVGSSISALYDGGVVTAGPTTDATYASAGKAGFGSFNGGASTTTGMHFDSIQAT